MKSFLLFVFGMFYVFLLVAQTPQAFKYQAVARDGSGNILANKVVSFRISILSGSSSGAEVYKETHTGKNTNSFGLVELEIGKGTVATGSFSAIPWSSNSYFVKVEMDPLGGSAYIPMGTSQLQSVPYALMAKTAENVNDADADPANEIQSISLSGTLLTLSKGGGTVTLPSSGGGDNWGTDFVRTDATLSGKGTSAEPLKIAQQAATSGQALKWNGTTWTPGNDLTGNTMWGTNGNSVFYNNGNVGLGTSSPERKLHLNTSLVNSGIMFTNDASGTTGDDGLHVSLQYQADSPGNRYGLILNKENIPLVIGTNNSYNQLYLQQTGNVGIGTSSPTANLDLEGIIRIRGGNPGAGKVLTSSADGTASWATPGASSSNWTLSGSILTNDNSNGGSVTIKSSGANPLRIDGGSNLYASFYEGGVYRGYIGSYSGADADIDFGTGIGLTGKTHLVTNATPRLTVDATGNVGIGNTAPTAKLHVTGTLRIADGTEAKYKVLTSDALGNASWQNPNPVYWDSNASGIYYNLGTVSINPSSTSVGTPLELNTNFPTSYLSFRDNVGASGMRVGSYYGNLALLNDNSGKDFFIKLNTSGGYTQPFTVKNSGNIEVTGEINKPDATGAANLLPIAYGNISSAGTINSSSGNIACIWNSSLSRYEITITGESFIYISYITTVTSNSSSPLIANVNSVSGKLLITLTNLSNVKVQDSFSFVVYKP